MQDSGTLSVQDQPLTIDSSCEIATSSLTESKCTASGDRASGDRANGDGSYQTQQVLTGILVGCVVAIVLVFGITLVILLAWNYKRKQTPLTR